MNVQLDAKQENQLKELAQKQGKPVGEVLRDLVEKALSEEPEVNGVVTGSRKPSPVCLAELRGVGKEIWQGENAQEYVNRLREEWK